MKLKLIYQKMRPREGDIPNNKQFFNLPLRCCAWSICSWQSVWGEVTCILLCPGGSFSFVPHCQPPAMAEPILEICGAEMG